MANDISRKREGGRRYELDWLRVGAVLLLIGVHTAAIFDPFPTTAVKGQSSELMKVFAIFVHIWRLAVLFIISGAGAAFAFGYLTPGRFIGMRFRRIVIPLIAGTLLVVPIQLYYWCNRLCPGRYSSYFQFYMSLISDALHGRIATKPEYLHWGHLWFLAYLFVSSLITLPLFLYLRGERGTILRSRFSSLIERRSGIILLALPLILSELILRPSWPGFAGPNLINDWANFSAYLIYYIYGFLIYSEERVRQAIQSWSNTALTLGVVSTVLFFLFPRFIELPAMGYNLKWMLFLVLRGFSAWFCIVTVFAFGMKLLNRNSSILSYANEAVYPVYVVHLPVSTMIAYHVVHWNIPVIAQFFVIVVSTVVCS